MLVRIAKACDECQEGDMAEIVADAVIAQVWMPDLARALCSCLRAWMSGMGPA